MYHVAAPARYSFIRRDSIVTLLPNGTEVPQVVPWTLVFTLTLAPPPPGTTGPLQVAIHADSLIVAADAPAMAQSSLTGVAGTTWTGSLAPDGVITGLVADRRSSGTDVVGLYLPRILPPLPPTGARPGQEWNDTIASVFPIQNLQVAETLANVSTAAAGASDDQLDVTANGTVTRSGTNGIFVLSGAGTRTARYTLSSDGTLLGATGSDSISMLISVKSVGQSVRMRQWGWFTVTPHR